MLAAKAYKLAWINQVRVWDVVDCLQVLPGSTIVNGVPPEGVARHNSMAELRSGFVLSEEHCRQRQRCKHVHKTLLLKLYLEKHNLESVANRKYLVKKPYSLT